MNIPKIRTALHLDKFISKRKVNKMVTILDHTIPGTSDKELLANKKQLAIWARNNGISNITVYDPRRKLGELDAGSMESRLGELVDIQLKNKKGVGIDETMHYFSSPKEQFLDKFTEQISKMAAFFKRDIYPVVNFNRMLFSEPLATRQMALAKTKIQKAASTQKIDFVDLRFVKGSKFNELELELKRIYSNGNIVTKNYYFDKTEVTVKSIIQHLNFFNKDVNKIPNR